MTNEINTGGFKNISVAELETMLRQDRVRLAAQAPAFAAAQGFAGGYSLQGRIAARVSAGLAVSA